MAVGCAVDCRWVYPVRSPRRSHQRRHAHSQEIAISQKSVSKSYTCSSAALTIDVGLSLAEETGEAKKNFSSVPELFRISDTLRREDAISHSPDDGSLQFSYLMENLHRIEGILVHSDVESLERDILIQIGRLGALELFCSSLPRTTLKPEYLCQSTLHSYHFREIQVDLLADENKPDHDVIVHSRKKFERKLRRKKARADMYEISVQPLSRNGDKKVENSSTSGSDSPRCSGTLTSSSHTDTYRRHHRARNESTLSMGVKDVAHLEKVHMKIEERIGRPVSFLKWAEAAGIDQKSLRDRLHYGWQCRDKLLRSTHSLVVYIAKNYKGRGIDFDDLLQAGKVGVLLGAERFDSSRGYRFSTYARYWIKKSMSSLVSQHSRGILIPARIERIIKEIQKARRSYGSHLQESELANITGISLANIRLANKCSRPMGSIDRKLHGELDIKLLDITSDGSVDSPNDVVLKQDFRTDIHKLLAELQPRERQVICLRYGIGLHDGRCRSLSEIGSLANVSKEWIRKIERAALLKLRDEKTRKALKHYIHLLQL